MSNLIKRIAECANMGELIAAVKASTPLTFKATTKNLKPSIQAKLKSLEKRLNIKSQDTKEFKETLKEYATLLFNEGHNDLTCATAYLSLLNKEPCNAVPYHCVGKLFERMELLRPASFVFHSGLELNFSDHTDDCGEHFHQRFHFDLYDIAENLMQKKQRLIDSGFPLERLGFQFSSEKGVFLPGFEHNIRNKYRNLHASGKVLAFIHYDLGMIPHQTADCPYLQYLSKKS